MPGLVGQYIYGDYIGGLIWLVARDAAGVWQNVDFMDTNFVISSFGEDEAGEVYLVDFKGGIYRLAEIGPVTEDDTETVTND